MKVVQAGVAQTFRLGLFEGMTGCNMTSQQEEASQERQQRSLSRCCFSLVLEFWKPFEPEYHSAGSVKRMLQTSHAARFAFRMMISYRRCLLSSLTRH